MGSGPRLVCLPSWDGEFSVHAAGLLAASPEIHTPSELEAALHPRYPGAKVRESELSGLRTPTWYVYRDGSFPWSSS